MVFFVGELKSEDAGAFLGGGDIGKVAEAWCPDADGDATDASSDCCTDGAGSEEAAGNAVTADADADAEFTIDTRGTFISSDGDIGGSFMSSGAAAANADADADADSVVDGDAAADFNVNI